MTDSMSHIPDIFLYHCQGWLYWWGDPLCLPGWQDAWHKDAMPLDRHRHLCRADIHRSHGKATHSLTALPIVNGWIALPPHESLQRATEQEKTEFDA